ncbi:protein phosphatase CheZ [Glaciecola siphonariae]|uniref:Protein phosphatase CheZ n=1 Tax=Glaciecola siphonariae TaxID=521012 RepID=A0ABV9LVM3_9ALTE
MTNEASLISLEEAKALVAHLESDEIESANNIVHSITLRESTELFSEVGKLTRQLHDSLSNFQLDERISSLTKLQIPDARSRLEYVIEETEKAANSTMDAVERSMPIAEALNGRLSSVLPEWKKLMSRQIELGEFKSLCLDLDKLLSDAHEDSATLNSMLTEVLMAQGYQDLTGQVIRRVIELVKDVEESLVDMLSAFSEEEAKKERHEKGVEKVSAQPSEKSDDKVKAEGPIIDAANRDDVAQSQDDVDDLLSSLGF